MGVSDLWECLDQHTILYIVPATVLSDKRDVVRIAVCLLCGLREGVEADAERKQRRTGKVSHLGSVIMISVLGMCITTIVIDNSFIISRLNIMSLISKLFCPCVIVYGHCERFER